MMGLGTGLDSTLVLAVMVPFCVPPCRSPGFLRRGRLCIWVSVEPQVPLSAWEPRSLGSICRNTPPNSACSRDLGRSSVPVFLKFPFRKTLASFSTLRPRSRARQLLLSQFQALPRPCPTWTILPDVFPRPLQKSNQAEAGSHQRDAY